MRKAQKEYFRTRTTTALNKSRALIGENLNKLIFNRLKNFTNP